MAKVPFCVQHYRREKDVDYGHHGKPRALKRWFRKNGFTDHVEMAYRQGEWDAERLNKPQRRFPPGKRHTAYTQGYNLADPLGDWHGHNI